MSRDLLFEIGVEELPAAYTYAEGGLEGAVPQLAQLLESAFADRALPRAKGEVVVHATPRRLAAIVPGISDREPDRNETLTGPAVKAAYDAGGKPTPALLGFCKGKGVDPAAVKRVQTPRGEYVEATIRRKGRPALEVLPELLESVATRIAFPKTMRWLVDDTRFARPVRWLVALLGDAVVPVQAFGLEAGRASHGHRFLAPARIELRRAADYLPALAKASVMVDFRHREEEIRKQLEREAKRLGGRVVEDRELIEINNFQIEWPTAFAGTFDRKYLELPREVIVMALREHQRFFAVEEARGGHLLPNFLALRNGDARNLDAIRRGNEGVLVARLEDARFYWEADLEHPPAERVEALAGVVWLEGLGSLRDKARRLEVLGEWLAERLAPEATGAVTRAAWLCKTDLLSEMIGSGKEYAALEGVMGSYYALHAGESKQVADAIAEHYRPRGPADALPASEAGVVLALADKLDHVAGAFVAGKVPSGSQDPFAVRRAANGVVRILVEQRRHLDLYAATMQSTAPFFAERLELPQAQIMKQLGDFWRGRVAGLIGGSEGARGQGVRDEGFAPDTVEVAMNARAEGRPGWADPYDCLLRTRVLHGFRTDPRFLPLVILFKRVANILAKAPEKLPATLDRERLTEPAERALADALDRARTATDPLWEGRRYEQILPALLEMEKAIHAFFDDVMVNVEDLPTRVNRLRLLAEVRELFVRGWDLSRIVVEGEK